MIFTQNEYSLESIKRDYKHLWLKLTDEQLDAIVDRRHHLVLKNQEASGDIDDDSHMQLSDWQRTQANTNI